MIEYIISILILYVSVTWFLRSLRISKDYGKLYVVVTGCDTGFGRELAYKLDKTGFNVFATFLTQEGATDLNKTTSERLRTVIVDLRKSETISTLFEFVKNTLPNETALWGIVNNAAAGAPFMPTSITSKTDCLDVFDVNLFGMMEVNRLFIPLLRKSRGRIINTSSIAGRLGSCFGSYVISKFGVEGYSDCLRRELYHQGVSVHIIEPTAYRTTGFNKLTKDVLCEYYERAIKRLPKEQRDYFGPDFSKNVGETYENFVCRSASSNLNEVIDAYFHALTARFPKIRYVVSTGFNGLFTRFMLVCPDWMSDFVIANTSLESVRPAGLSE